MVAFNIAPTSTPTTINQTPVSVKPEAASKPTGNFSLTPGTVGSSDRTSVDIANAKKCDCTEKRTTSLGGTQNTIPESAKQKITAEKQTLPPAAQENIASDIAKAKKCDCTEKRTTSLGGSQNTIPDSAKQKITAEKQSLPPAAQENIADDIANAKKCDCTAKRTTSLGGSQNAIPSESKQKVVSEQLASRFGYESKVNSKSGNEGPIINATVKNQTIATVGSNQSNQTVSANTTQLVAQRAVTVQVPTAQTTRQSPVQILNTSVTAQTQSVQIARQSVLNKSVITPLIFNFGEAVGSKMTVKFSNQVPVMGQANQSTQINQPVSQQLMAKTAEKLTQQIINKFGEMTDKNGVKLTALQKALAINDPKLIKEMLNVKANSYGYVNLATLRQGIEANFLKHSDLDKMLKTIFGQSFNPEAIEENLNDPLQLFAEYLKEQRRLKILKKHEEENRHKQKRQQEEESETEDEDELEPVLAI